jgi:protocatechuate 3,4-dioxygenase beta subunit
MKLVFACWLILLVGGTLAQNPSAATPSSKRAAIEGTVTRDPDSEPVKKALIELIAENQAEGGNYTATTGSDGIFRIDNILPGRYHLFAERSGFIETDKSHGRSDGRVLTLTTGQLLKDLHIRLQAAAVVRGRVTDEDGDPLPNAEVSVLRQSFVSGRNHWEQAGAERTNDLGEYRIANLPPGNVYVSVVPPPDFKNLIEQRGVSGGDSHSVEGEKPATSYQTTYYPGTTDRSQAASIQLHAGDDFPLDFAMIPTPSLSIRGAVVNLPPRTSASIMLQSRDFGLVLNGAEMHKDGSFVIRDVSPGNYTILATVDGAVVPMTARQALQVASNVDGLRLAPQPGATVRGRLRLEGGGEPGTFDPDRIFLALQTMEGEQEGALTIGENFSNLTHVAADGTFQWVDVPAGNYYLQMAGDNGASEAWYLKSALAGGRDINDSGISINGGLLALDLVASANGGVVEGAVIDHKGEPMPNAVVVAVPEARMRSRVDRYRKTVSDQSGHFSLRGLRPGQYTLLAWESIEGGAYYNSEFLKAYEGWGTILRVGEGDRKTLQVEAITATEQQP